MEKMFSSFLYLIVAGVFTLSACVSNTPVLTATALQITETSQPTNNKKAIPTPTLSIGSTMIGADGVTLVYVPAGEFTMGSDVNPDEQPIHIVYLDAYWVDETEVTNKLFSSFVGATDYQTDAEKIGSSYVWHGSNWAQINGANWRHPIGPNSDISGKEKHPVIHISWNDAVAYCKWVGRRLPSEAEWEKAARGTDGRAYPWGNNIPNDNLLNFNNSIDDTTEVGKYPDGKSVYSAYDMAGNVWEWVNDWYGRTYYQNSPSSNPLGPDSSQYRVLRGGAWVVYDYLVRSAYRSMNYPTYSGNGFGFRCVRSQ
jgi:eukaryotic-like serine/threonine-protein kinase